MDFDQLSADDLAAIEMAVASAERNVKPQPRLPQPPIHQSPSRSPRHPPAQTYKPQSNPFRPLPHKPQTSPQPQTHLHQPQPHKPQTSPQSHQHQPHKPQTSHQSFHQPQPHKPQTSPHKPQTSPHKPQTFPHKPQPHQTFQPHQPHLHKSQTQSQPHQPQPHKPQPYQPQTYPHQPQSQPHQPQPHKTQTSPQSLHQPQPHKPQTSPHRPQTYPHKPQAHQSFQTQPHKPQAHQPQTHPHQPQPHHPQPHKPPTSPQSLHPQPHRPQPQQPQPHQPHNPHLPYQPQPHQPQPRHPQPHLPKPQTFRPQPHQPLTHPHQPQSHKFQTSPQTQPHKPQPHQPHQPQTHPQHHKPQSHQPQLHKPQPLPSSNSHPQHQNGSGISWEMLQHVYVDFVDLELLTSRRFDVGAVKDDFLMDYLQQYPGLESSPRKTWNLPLENYQEFVKHMRLARIKVKEIPGVALDIAKQIARGKQLEERVEGESEAERLFKEKLDLALQNTLMPFQREGVIYGLKKKGRVLIADEMGLGKTLQAISLSAVYRDEWPVLVVCPSSVRLQWASQFTDWLGDIVEKDISIVLNKKSSFGCGEKICITSYDMASRLADDFGRIDYQVIIADECHFLKNSQAKRTQSVLPLLQNAKRAILLSGTPALSRPKELFTQIQAINSKLFPNFFTFANRYCDATQTRFGLDCNGSSNLKELHVILSSFMIRRIKTQVLTQLPPKRRSRVYISVADKHIKSLQEARQKLKTASVKQQSSDISREDLMDERFEARSLVMGLFQATGTAKIPAVTDWILDKLNIQRDGRKTKAKPKGKGGKEKVDEDDGASNVSIIVFAHHQDVLNALEQALNSYKQDYIRIDGQTPAHHRKDLVDYYQTNPGCRVALLSITAAGCGLTLTKATVVIFAELYWNPGSLRQAEDRAHRIGQEFSVNVYYLVARNTLDEIVWEKLKKKLEVVGEAVDGQGGVLSAEKVEAETSPTEVEKGSLMSEIMQSISDITNRKRRRDFNVQEEPEAPKKRGRKALVLKSTEPVPPDEWDDAGSRYQPQDSSYSSRGSVEENAVDYDEENGGGDYYEEPVYQHERATTVKALPQGGDGKSKLDRFSFPKKKK